MAQQEGLGRFTAEPLQRRCSTGFFKSLGSSRSLQKNTCQRQHGKEEGLKDKHTHTLQRYHKIDQLQVKLTTPLATDTWDLVTPRWSSTESNPLSTRQLTLRCEMYASPHSTKTTYNHQSRQGREPLICIQQNIDEARPARRLAASAQHLYEMHRSYGSVELLKPGLKTPRSSPNSSFVL